MAFHESRLRSGAEEGASHQTAKFESVRSGSLLGTLPVWRCAMSPLLTTTTDRCDTICPGLQVAPPRRQIGSAAPHGSFISSSPYAHRLTVSWSPEPRPLSSSFRQAPC